MDVDATIIAEIIADVDVGGLLSFFFFSAVVDVATEALASVVTTVDVAEMTVLGLSLSS